MVGESSKVSGRAGARGGSCEGDAPRGPGSRRSDCLVACAKGRDAGHPVERASGCPQVAHTTGWRDSLRPANPRSSGPRKSFGPPRCEWRCSPARCGAPRVPERRLAAWIVVLVHGAPRAVLGGTVERPEDDPAGWPEQPFGGAGRLGRGRACRCPARSHARIARVAADPPRRCRRARAAATPTAAPGVCACTAATFSAGSRAPRSTRSIGCAGWRSRACVGRGKSPAQTHLNAQHGPQEPNNRARAAQDDGAFWRTRRAIGTALCATLAHASAGSALARSLAMPAHAAVSASSLRLFRARARTAADHREPPQTSADLTKP